MSIYIKESDIPKTGTRKDLIRKFLRGVVYPSYLDTECTQVQCQGSKFRSITELHEIVKSRFPVTSLKAIIKIIYQIIAEDQSVILVYCTQVNKVVLKYQPNKSAEWISNYSRKNYFTTKGEDGYSLEDFEEIKETL